MLLLALDTATRYSSIALCTENDLLSEYNWFSANNHSTELLGHLERMLAEHALKPEQLDAIIVAIGPGSFNGVRVALATAKALAFSLQKPLVGVSTLDIIAVQHHHWRGPLFAMLEAGRGELYAASYHLAAPVSAVTDSAYHIERTSDYVLQTPHQLVEQMQTVTGNQQEPILCTGEISATSRQALRTLLGERCVFAHNIASTRRAASLAVLGLQQLRQGKEDDPLALEPMYLRRPSITKSTRKQPLLGGTSQSSTGPDTTEREKGALRH